MRSTADDHWRRYYEAVEGRPPRATLLRALDAFEQEGLPPDLAIDLGAGTGRDSLELLQRGWRVLAIDGEAAALAALAARVGPTALLETRAERFEAITELPSCRLINASFALPFCPPAAFHAFWGKIRTALQPGGRFAGQLLGPDDDWADDAGVTAVPATALPELLQGYRVESCEEERYRGRTAKGKSKHWHLCHLVLRREKEQDSGAATPGTASPN